MRFLALGSALLFLLSVSVSLADGKSDFEAARKADLAGAVEKALKLYTSAIKSGELQQNDLGRAYYFRAQRYFYTKRQWDLAIADLNTLLRLKPKHSQALFWRSLVYRERGYHRFSLDDIQRAFEDRKRMRKTYPPMPNYNPGVAVDAYCNYGCDSGVVSCRKICVEDNKPGSCGWFGSCRAALKKCNVNCSSVWAGCSRWCTENRGKLKSR